MRFWRDLLENASLKDPLVITHEHQDAVVRVKGKSTKEIKEEVIPELRAKAEYYFKKYQALKNTPEELIKYKKTTYRKKLAKQIPTQVLKDNENRKKREINKKGKDLYARKLINIIARKTTLLDGVYSYGTMYRFCRRENKKMSINYFCVVLICYVNTYVKKSDYLFYGFGEATFGKYLNELSENNFLSKLRVGRAYVYTATYKTNDLVKEYLEYHTSQMKVLVKRIKENKKNVGVISEYQLEHTKKLANAKTKPE